MNGNKTDLRQNLKQVVTTTSFLAMLTTVNYFLDKIIDYRALGMIYLMGITAASLYLKNYNIVLATLLGAMSWNLLFIPPRFTFSIHAPEDWALIVLYLVAGLVIGTLMKRLKEKEIDLRGKMVNEESERIYKTLLNSVSHEIRTPLSAIKGFSSALLDRDLTNDPERIRTIAEEISHGAERLDYVVQNLLDMSRLESGNLKLKLDYADVVETLNTAVRKVKKFHGEKSVSIRTERDLPLIYVDYFLFEQVLENIIRNAFLYTPPSTPLEIDIEKEEHLINITITDHGPGLKSTNPDEIFKKFYRERPQETGGLGLGLSICKSILELHKGYISVENISPSGARFIIKIPRELDREMYPT
jgi:two-component system sensor histidine kinase KdpD